MKRDAQPTVGSPFPGRMPIFGNSLAFEVKIDGPIVDPVGPCFGEAFPGNDAFCNFNYLADARNISLSRQGAMKTPN